MALYLPVRCPPESPFHTGLPASCNNIFGWPPVPPDEGMGWASIIGAVVFACAWAYYAFKEPRP